MEIIRPCLFLKTEKYTDMLSIRETSKTEGQILRGLKSLEEKST